MLLRVPQVLSTPQVQHIRQMLDQADWTDGAVTAGTQSAQTKNNWQLPEHSGAAQQARELVLGALAVSATYLTGALPKRIYPPLFNRYEGSKNAFGNHIDNAVRTHAASGRHVRTDVSCTLFLSEPDEYEGGELIIEDTYGSQSIKLAAGDMVLYPSASVHRVMPVTRGARVACFFWTESMVRADEQRRLLYDLDMTIMRYRQQHGDDAESVRLTGIYHNLMRMWVDV